MALKIFPEITLLLKMDGCKRMLNQNKINAIMIDHWSSFNS